MSLSGQNRRRVLPHWWGKNFLKVELGLAVLVGAAAFAWGYLFDGNQLIGEALGKERGDLYSALSSIFGSLFGFAITAASIVLGVSGSERLSVLRESPYYGDLWDTFLSTIRWLGVATVVALVALVLDRAEEALFLLVHAVLFTVAIVTLRLARTVWVLERVIIALTRPSDAPSNGGE